MIELPRHMLALIGLVAGLWLVVGIWLTVRAATSRGRTEASRAEASRSHSLLETSPAMPLIVHGHWVLLCSQRLADRLGLPHPPARVEELSTGSTGLDPADL
jgi:hypothetical protein